MGNRNSSNSKVHGHTAKVASTEPQYVPRQGKPSTKVQVVGFSIEEGHGTKGAAFRGEEYIGKTKTQTPGTLRGQHDIGVYSEQQCKIPLDNDDTFTNYIRHAKYKIRNASNIGGEQSNPVPSPAPDGANGTNNKENQRDQFSDFIQLAKKKLRTASRIEENSSFNRG